MDSATFTSDILIVDDNPVNLVVMSGLLEKHGLRFRVATSGRRAISAARARVPDLILLDVTMPEMDGYEVCRQLKADPLTREVPIIFLSALDDALDKVKAFRAGAADYVAKPFQFEEVLARVEHELQIARLKGALQIRNSELAAKNELLVSLSHKLERANEELARLSVTDALTGIPNRRQFHEVLESEWRRAQRDRGSMAVMMIDVDFFKAYNDEYGHQRGDECLRSLAGALQSGLLRAADFVGRYGGEEFVVILPDANAELARAQGERLCERVRELAISHERSAAAPIVTVSIGCAAVVPELQTVPATLITHADRALYEAKRSGRNRVTYADESRG